MNLVAWKEDDIVELDGRLAFLLGRVKGRKYLYRVRFAHGARETRTVNSTTINRHWRQAPS